MKKFGVIYDNIITIDNLLLAWREFLCGKRQRIDMVNFQSRLMDNICVLQQELVDKNYCHGSYCEFNISDPKPRIIHKAAVRDRLVHHLLYTQLYSYFDTKFIYDSYSCRLGKGTHKAMRRFKNFGLVVSKNNSKNAWILKGDIKKFFASIDHEILITALKGYIADEDLLWLLSHIVDSFSTAGKLRVGLPLGNLTSQLLVNIYMNEFDQFVKRELKMRHYIRYADDFVIFYENYDYLVSLIPLIEKFLMNSLKLSLHPDKLFIKTLASGVDFLGWVHFPKHRVMRRATKLRMMRKLATNQKEATRNSYLGLIKHGNTYKLRASLFGEY